MVDITPSILNNNVQVKPEKTSQDIGVGGGAASAKYAERARTWAEGTDAEVEELGGEHSAKGWAQSISDGFMPKSGGTFTGDVTFSTNGTTYPQIKLNSNSAGTKYVIIKSASPGWDTTGRLEILDNSGYGLLLKDEGLYYVYAGVNSYPIISTRSVNSSLSDSSVYPVQNKVVTAALNEKMPLAGGTFAGDITIASGKKINFQQSNISENNAGNIIIGGGNGNGLVVTKNGSGAALFYNNGSDYTEVVTRNDVKSTYSSTGTDPLNGTAVAQALVNFTGADGDNAGTSGMVPAPAAADNTKFLRGDGTWADAGSGEGVYTTTNLIAGTNTTITQVEQPIIDSNTVGLYHCDSAATVDYGIMTGSLSFGSLSDDYKKFGEKSWKLNTSSSSTSVVFSNGSNISSGDFTIDWWFIATKHTAGDIGSFSPGKSSPAYFSISRTSDATNPISITPKYNQTVLGNTATFPGGNFIHLAYERESGTGRLYANGTLLATTADSRTYFSDSCMLTATTGSNYNDKVYIDEIRISNTARYHGNSFTPFSLPYTQTASNPIYQINNNLSSILGYNASATQVLKNVNGVLTWVTE